MSRALRPRLLLPILLLAALPVAAQAPVEITPDVVYGHKDGMAMTFDVFQPESNANGIGLIHMVSGGWVSSWTPPEQAVQRYRFLLDQGFTVFSVRHGSSPRYLVPDAFSDVKLATRYINLHGTEFGVDPERLGVWGSSAGGHLSLMLGLTADEGNAAGTTPVESAPSRIAAVVAYFPPTDLRSWAGPSERFPALDFDPTLAESISPVLHVDGDTPPTLLMHGDEDTLVPIAHSERLHAIFQESGVTAEFIPFPGQGHGFRGEDAQRGQREVVEWFTKHLVNAAVATR
ncbi:MAG: alpha/beta hydrolase [Gemmatimonadota bacterium]